MGPQAVSKVASSIPQYVQPLIGPDQSQNSVKTVSAWRWATNLRQCQWAQVLVLCKTRISFLHAKRQLLLLREKYLLHLQKHMVSCTRQPPCFAEYTHTAPEKSHHFSPCDNLLLVHHTSLVQYKLFMYKLKSSRTEQKTMP